MTADKLDELAVRIGSRAHNIYDSRQNLCAGAALETLNAAFGGGLTERQARALSTTLPIGVGGSGCMCGALSGSLIALGLILGQEDSFSDNQLRNAGRRLHDAFKTEFRSTCCRVLSRPFKDDRKAHFHNCAGLTRDATAMAARIILEMRPQLADTIDNDFVSSRQGKIAGLYRRLRRSL